MARAVPVPRPGASIAADPRGGTSTRRQVRDRLGGGLDVAACPERGDRFVQGLHRVGVASGVEGSLAETNERLGAFGMSDGGERKGPLQVRRAPRRYRGRARALRERQEPECRCLELGGLVPSDRPLGRARLPSSSGRRGRRRRPRSAQAPSMRSTGPRRHVEWPGRFSGAAEYATSRANMCQKAYSASPAIEDRRAGRTSSLRESSRSVSVTAARSRSPIAAIAPVQKTFPMTAASATIDFASAESMSRRAAMRAWTNRGAGPRLPRAAPSSCSS